MGIFTRNRGLRDKQSEDHTLPLRAKPQVADDTPRPAADAEDERSPPIAVNIYVQSRQVFSTDLPASLQLGRQHADEAPPYVRVGNRLVIAGIDETNFSREHVLLARLRSGKIQVTNQSRVNAILVGTDHRVQPGETTEVGVPAVLTIGDRVIELEHPRVRGEPGLASSADVLESFLHQTLPPGPSINASIADVLAIGRSDEETEYLLRGLHATIGVFQLATNSSEFLQTAAQAMIDIVGLETAAAMLWDNGQWRVAAFCTQPGIQSVALDEWSPSYTILERVRNEDRTFWGLPDGECIASLADVKALIAAPILNHKAEVVGALYGDRRRGKAGRFIPQITQVEAILVELLSTSVAAGLARLEQEKKAVQARVLFEQFFTPELSRQLETQPDLLLAKETEVSLLCCDIGGFSRVSEQLGARLTLDWINDVMGTLSGCVDDHAGVLVDTLGDKLIGMWGAPQEQADHAQLACRTAIAMFERLPALNRRWQNVLDEPIDLRVGIHSGTARVGNIGSERKFQYGPLGNTVHVAGRAEAATRQLSAKIVITGATASSVGDEFLTRRLCRLTDPKVGEPIELFELAADDSDDWPEVKQRYEAALAAYERSDLPTAIRLLAKILAEHPGDRPSLSLLSRIGATPVDPGSDVQNSIFAAVRR